MGSPSPPSGSGGRRNSLPTTIEGVRIPAATMFPTSGRRLLGGDMGDSPQEVCEDPCFVPWVRALLKAMGALNNPACAAMMDNDRRTAPSSSRRLLGGSNPDADQQQQMEVGIGMMCAKNAAGDY